MSKDILGPLADLAQEITGKTVYFEGNSTQTLTEIYCEPGSQEAVVHELCHWFVATEEERGMFNLGLTTDWKHLDPLEPPPAWWSPYHCIMRELEAVVLQRHIVRGLEPIAVADAVGFLKVFDLIEEYLEEWGYIVNRRVLMVIADHKSDIQRVSDMIDPDHWPYIDLCE